MSDLNKENVFVRVTSAISISGVIHKAGAIIELMEDEAKALLARGKVEVATVLDKLEGKDPDADPRVISAKANAEAANKAVADAKAKVSPSATVAASTKPTA